MEYTTARHSGLAAVVAAFMALEIAGCRNGLTDSQQVQPMAGKTIQQVQEEHTDQWMAIPGGVGAALGECDGKPCILVFTSSDTAQVRRKIPATVDGYPVVVQPMGEVRARNQ